MAETQSTIDAASPFRRLLLLTDQSTAALDRAFSEGRSDVMPTGSTVGIGLAWPGTWISAPLAWFFQLFWKGKIFGGPNGQVLNRVLPFDMTAIRAVARTGTSAFDDRPCIVIDYSGIRLIGGMVRDEIREIEPGTYLGLVYVFGYRAMKFALIEHDRTPGDNRT